MNKSLGPDWQTRAEKREEMVEQIAQEFLGFTLKTQNSDGLDFHDVSVWAIRQVMELAYVAGQRQAAADIKGML